MSVAPNSAVTMDPVFVGQELSRETRRRLEERKSDPDGLDSKGAAGGDGTLGATPVLCALRYRAATVSVHSFFSFLFDALRGVGQMVDSRSDQAVFDAIREIKADTPDLFLTLIAIREEGRVEFVA